MLKNLFDFPGQFYSIDSKRCMNDVQFNIVNVCWKSRTLQFEMLRNMFYTPIYTLIKESISQSGNSL